MKLELIIVIVTIFFIMNTYHEGKYFKVLTSWKKYYTMIGYGFIGLSIYLFIRKKPGNTHDLVKHATSMIKHMPMSKEPLEMLSPFLDTTNDSNVSYMMDTYQRQMNQQGDMNPRIHNAEKKIMSSGNGSTKRSVSETKKKFVAARQGWNCEHCKKQLPAWFEVDHVLSLENGGSNHVDNLEALCRDCHGKKTCTDRIL
jgi:hypothetical protein